jgi:hypothetical protein
MRRSRQAPPRPLRIHAHEPWKYVGAGLALIGAGALVKTLLDRR